MIFSKRLSIKTYMCADAQTANFLNNKLIRSRLHEITLDTRDQPAPTSAARLLPKEQSRVAFFSESAALEGFALSLVALNMTAL